MAGETCRHVTHNGFWFLETTETQRAAKTDEKEDDVLHHWLCLVAYLVLGYGD